MTARSGGLPEKVRRYKESKDGRPGQVRSRSLRLAKALLCGQAAQEAGTRVVRSNAGGRAWVMLQGEKMIAIWHPKSGTLKVRLILEQTIIDRLNAISAMWCGELWFYMEFPNRNYASKPIVKFRNRHDCLENTVYTVTSFPAKEF